MTKVADLTRMVAESRELKDEKDEKEKSYKLASAAYQGKLLEIERALEAEGLDSFKTKAGTVSKKTRWSCRVPKSPSERAEFFSWLKEKGWFESWITVHSATLNSEYKRLYEEAAEKGELFHIPGVGPPNMQTSVVLRKSS